MILNRTENEVKSTECSSYFYNSSKNSDSEMSGNFQFQPAKLKPFFFLKKGGRNQFNSCHKQSILGGVQANLVCAKFNSQTIKRKNKVQ